MSGCDRMQRTLRKRLGNEPILLTVCEGDFQEVRRLVEKTPSNVRMCMDGIRPMYIYNDLEIIQ